MTVAWQTVPPPPNRMHHHRGLLKKLVNTALLCLGPLVGPPLLPAAGIDLQRIGASAAVTEQDLSPPSILLLPIVKIERSLQRVDALIQDEKGWQEALDILSQPPFTKHAFKDTFNAYSDNVQRLDYVVLPGVGRTVPPRTQQSIQYLLRNEALDNVESLRAEIEYLLGERKKGAPLADLDLSGLKEFMANVREDVKQYLQLADAQDVQSIRNALDKGKGARR